MDEFKSRRRIIREAMEGAEAASPRMARGLRREAFGQSSCAPRHVHIQFHGPITIIHNAAPARSSPQTPEINLPEEGEGD